MRNNFYNQPNAQSPTSRMFRRNGANCVESTVMLQPVAVTNQNLICGNAAISPEMTLRPIPDVITFNLDNSAGAAPVKFLMFDGYGFNVANGGLVVVAPTAGSSSVAAMKLSTIGNPFLLAGFTYQSTVSSTQLNQPFSIVRGDMDGSYGSVPTILGASINNEQYTRDIQTYRKLVAVDGYTGILNTVKAAETVDLYLFVHTVYNRVS